eukprot:XP_001695025.1 predicted protein [Chlamydomonas reinhardtii]
MHGVRVKKFPQYKAKLAAMASLDEDSPITSLPTNKFIRWPDGLPLVCYASGHVHGTVAIHTAVVEWACNHDPAFKADYERAVAEREEAAKQRKEGGMQAAGARDMRQATARGVTAASDEDNNIELGTEAPQRGNKQPKPGSKSRRQLTDAEAAEVVATYKEKRAAGLKNKEVWPAINAALGKDWSRNKMEAAAKAARIWTQDRRGPKSKRNDDLEEEDAQDSEGGRQTTAPL